MSTAAEVRPFDACGPLPTGVTVLEASAGTGKTYTIAALAARYVAEGTRLDDLLLVTFTRMATGELRDRVRERFVSLEQILAGTLAPPPDDAVAALLREGSAADVAARRDNIAAALADFDAATITTTHGFCQEVVASLGVAGDAELDTVFVEDVSDLLGEVVDDLYVRRFAGGGDPPRISRAEALKIATLAVDNPAAPIHPAESEDQTTAAMRGRLARAVRRELDRRMRLGALMSYDDLLMRLDATLRGTSGDEVVATLRRRFKIVLVDEFQDTDPVQWSIVHRAFGDGEGTLVLIGDPKQAIYSFRGADVYAYLAAAEAAGTRATLQTNWRSDQGLLDAYDALFGRARLGHPGIVYRQVQAAAGNRAPRLTGAPVPAPLRVRILARERAGLTTKGYAQARGAREAIACDLANDLVRLLSSGATVAEEGDEAVAVCPGHVAVLVRTNRQAALVRDALEDVGVPAVINGAGSVFGTEPAREWLRLLEALERPASPTRAASVALTAFLGWTPAQVAAATEDDWEAVHQRLHEWARVLRLRGVASLLEAITLGERLPGRVLATVDGERRLTDLRHVAQLLHAVAMDEQLGTTALVGWLRSRIADAATDTADEERSRRLESDAEAVQVLTIHRSKGLEFPVVYAPFVWDPTWIRDEREPVAYHDPDAGNQRMIDVGLEGEEYEAHRTRSVLDERGEDLRLAYVALTRAKHQAVIWWAGTWDARNGALGRLCFAQDEDGDVQAYADAVPDDATVRRRFDAIALTAPGCVSVEDADPGPPLRWAPAPGGDATLSAATFDRRLDFDWRRTSYSNITAGAYEARVASEPEQGGVEDERDAGIPLPGPAPGEADDGLAAVPSLLGDMPPGARVGTFVHRVLEATDFAAPDLRAELDARVREALAWRAVDVGPMEVVVDGLQAAIATPLGPLAGGARLRDLARSDRLDELEFELPLAGGDDPDGTVALGAIAAVLRDHLPVGDPLARYPDRLEDPALRAEVRGYLTGSIDLVARLPGEDGGPRFAVVDYKSNHLGAPGVPLTAWHHRPAALAEEMEQAHYALQGLLYTAALHRYLRWRLPGYAPDRHLAGILYLFVRGMVGPDTPAVDGVPCGVFAWRPPAALVEALSDALDAAA